MSLEEEGTRGDLEFGTIARLVHIAAERYGDDLAIVDHGHTVTFGELEVESRRVAKALIASGIEHGDRISIWAPNMLEWVVAALGAHSVGGVLVPVNTRYKGVEAAYLLQKSQARVLFTVTDFLDVDYVSLLRETNPDLPALESIVVLRGEAPEGTVGLESFLERGSTISDEAVNARRDAVQREDLSDILFTSGTTGKPKGGMCTHAQTLRAFFDWSDIVGLRRGDRYLVVAPFFHSFGYKAGWLAALMMGATVYPQPVFDVDIVLKRIGADRITMLPGPPALYQTILARPDLDSFDLSSLRLAVTGAASIPVELIHKMRDVLKFDSVVTAYGLTETSGCVSICRQGDSAEVIANTSGRTFPGVEARVVDPEGNEVPRGEPGEIIVRGYNVMKGYFDEPEQTAEAIDSDGWVHTGDIGVMDENGYLKITDRMKDMFIVGGFNAYPAEIENILSTHDKIAQVAVVGMPDPRLGEVGAAFVVLKHGEELSEDELIAWSRNAMANFKVPRKVVFVDALPTNATGKVVKFELRKRLGG
jgi:acyl-CoA synthetase (AMP-forming)/AMP-acid ligase II